MKQPTLVIMAAGIGSRFGGLKQLAPVGMNGEPILEFSLYDALDAGFKKVIFIIKKEIYDDFKVLIGSKLEKTFDIQYVFQELDMIPPGYSIPEDRIKPWGTGHAVLCAKANLDGPFAVINADDYYGKDAFRVIYDYLRTQKDDEKYRFSMVGYLIENTLTDNGHVTRGVCQTDKGLLTSIDERHQIEKRNGRIQYTQDQGKSWTDIQQGTIVSMNLWGFSQAFLAELGNSFPSFLDATLKTNPLKGEYLLPTIVNELLEEGRASVKVLNSKDEWYGITYKEDLPAVRKSIQAMQKKGLYPEVLFK